MDEHEIRARLKEVGRCKSATELKEPFPPNSSYNEIARTAYLRFDKTKEEKQCHRNSTTEKKSKTS